MNSKNKRILISSIILSILSIGFMITYGFFEFSDSINGSVTINAGVIDVTLTSGDSINLTNNFPMSYEDAYNAKNNTMLFTINKNMNSSYIYYGVKIVPTEENTMPIEYISFDIGYYNSNKTGTDDYGEDAKEQDYILRNTKLSEYGDNYVHTSYINSSKEELFARVWINDDVRIGNMEGCISSTEWANLVTSVKVVIEASEKEEGFEPLRAYLYKSQTKVNKFLKYETYTDFISTRSNTYNSVQDDLNMQITYIYPFKDNFVKKAAYVETINFEKISTAKLEDYLINKTEDTDYFVHTDTTYHSATIIGYFEELYTQGSYTCYSYNIVSDKTIMFPKDSANLFEFATDREKSNDDEYNWGLFGNSGDANVVTNYFKNIQEINLNNVDTRNVVDFGYMFQNLTKLKKVDVSKLNTSVAKRLSGMFLWCKSLTSLDLSNLDTSRAERIDWMFAGSNIVETETEKNFIGLEDLDVSNVMYLDNIFTDCPNIEYLDLRNWRTGEIQGFILNNINEYDGREYYDEDGKYGFYNNCHYVSNRSNSSADKYCYVVGGIMGGNHNYEDYDKNNNLKYLDISNFNMSKVTNLNGFFRGYTNLEVLKIDNWDTSSVTDFDYFLFCCNSLKEFDISSLNTGNATTMSCTFANFGGSTYVYDFSELNTSKVTCFVGTFCDLTNATSLDFSSLNTSSATDMRGMFRNCPNLESIDLSNCDFSNCLNLKNFFYGDSKLTNITFATNIDVSKCTKFTYMFDGCSSLENVDLSHFSNSVVADFGWMFYQCSNLKSVDLHGFNTANTTSIYCMFDGCSSLEHIYVSNDFVTTNLTSSNYFVRDCSKLPNFSASTATDKTRAVIYDPLDSTNIGVLELYTG